MDGLWQPPRRLHSRGANCRGLAIDMDGVVLGTACDLVRKTSQGYRALEGGDLREQFKIQADYDSIARRLSSIARALDSGDLLHAQLLGLQLPFAIDTQQVQATDFLKTNYDPAEERNAHGEWTAAFESIGSLASSIADAGLTLAEEVSTGIGARLGAGALAGGTVGLLAGVVYPSGNWLTYQGTLPDHPDIDYRYDEGDLALYRTAEHDKPTLIYRGRADQGGFYRDDQGNIVGRDLGHGFQILSDSIVTPLATITNTRSQARVIADTDEPEICPAPGPDQPHGASARAIAYQWQITGLAPGLGVMLNGKIFDGCNPVTGHMLEAKGEGYAGLMRIKSRKDDLLNEWFKEADEQSQKADGRIVEWHFAEESVAIEASRKFAGLKNVVVVYTPPVVKLSPIMKARFHEFCYVSRLQH